MEQDQAELCLSQVHYLKFKLPIDSLINNKLVIGVSRPGVIQFSLSNIECEVVFLLS